MTPTDGPNADFYKADGVLGYFHTDKRYPAGTGSYIVVDDKYEAFKITLTPIFDCEFDGAVSVSLAVCKPAGDFSRWIDLTGDLAYALKVRADCDDTLTIDDSGRFVAMSCPWWGTSLKSFRLGCDLQLPANFVPAVRIAIELARKAAVGSGVAPPHSGDHP